jgi:hypothetical protein
MDEPQFVSLWPGPHLSDHVESQMGPTICSNTWITDGGNTGLYGLDREGNVWILCQHVGWSFPRRWIRLTEFLRAQADMKAG